MKGTTVYASQTGAALDSNVITGGGTDDTRALQAALDLALTMDHLHLILDGAALISASLRIHSNTTIECPNPACGLFLADHSDCSLVHNADWSVDEIRNENIMLLGGTYNHNAPGQIHDHGEFEADKGENPCTSWVIGMEFYGVRGLTIRDVTIQDQRTFTMLLAQWENVTMENVHIRLVHHMWAQNQDGLHFFGPGRRLTLKNISGNSSDDFIALAPDEVDRKSSMEDVLIDGVTLLGADQGIRMLCRGEGRLDRVTVRNVTGVYRGYGFYINPWFEDRGGNYGNIVQENIDIRCSDSVYDYRPPFLFDVAGNIECLTLRNIYHHRPTLPVQLLTLGGDYSQDLPETETKPTHIGRLILDGLYVDEEDPAGLEDTYIHVRSRVDELIVKNVHMKRAEGLKGGCLIRVDEKGSVGKLIAESVYAEGLEESLSAERGSVRKQYIENVRLD